MTNRVWNDNLSDLKKYIEQLEDEVKMLEDSARVLLNVVNENPELAERLGGDGFTTRYIVDIQSGTWFDFDNARVIHLTSDQTNRFDEMSDSERNEYAEKYGRKIIGLREK